MRMLCTKAILLTVCERERRRSATGRRGWRVESKANWRWVGKRNGRVWRRRSEGRGWEFVEVIVGGGGRITVAGAGLAEGIGGADKVEWQIVGGDSLSKYKAFGWRRYLDKWGLSLSLSFSPVSLR
ncbi:hypothetical protein L6452_12105 [Arctium lappa]|uniref:Uncharacterized protein n=1 Tax=Arctium lappa TaxID=4217 RepID=A0ACB9DQE3_ARCLA|nr:hypothetical protein L6452_12105 [Arctium lappa]